MYEPSGTYLVVLSITAGNTAKAWYVPVLQSNTVWAFYMVADASGSGKEPSGFDANITLSLYDSFYFQNNDVTPSSIDVGVEDEDGGEVGVTAPDTEVLYIAA